MPKAYVVAPEGVRLKVTVQRYKSFSVPQFSHTISMDIGIPVTKTVEIAPTVEWKWVDEIVIGPIASESREFELEPDLRLLVEAL